MDKSYKPKNYPDFLPYLIVVDAAKSLEFYKKAFGFREENLVRDENGKIAHAELSFGEALIMFAQEGAFGSTKKAPVTQKIVDAPVTFYLYCENVDSLYSRATAAGAKVVSEPSDAFWGDRYCTLLDIDGYEWSFGSYLGKDS